MKFKKSTIKDKNASNAKTKITAKDVCMVRVTVEFPVLKNNFDSESISSHLESAASDMHYGDKEEKWFFVETSDVTDKDLKDFLNKVEEWYLYNPKGVGDDDIPLKDIISK